MAADRGVGRDTPKPVDINIVVHLCVESGARTGFGGERSMNGVVGSTEFRAELGVGAFSGAPRGLTVVAETSDLT